MKNSGRHDWEWNGSDAGPEWDPEEEARMLKEIENDRTIDWKQESLDAVDWKNVEEINGDEDDFEPGSESDDYLDTGGNMMHPSAYKAAIEQESRKRELAAAEQKMVIPGPCKKTASKSKAPKDNEANKVKKPREATPSNAQASTSAQKTDTKAGGKRKRIPDFDEDEKQNAVANRKGKGKGKARAAPAHATFLQEPTPGIEKPNAKKAKRTYKEASKADV